jgi:hypothetical protein
MGTRFGLPAASWMREMATVFLRTETELVLKNRCVIPRSLPESGFRFQSPDWLPAAQNLVARWRATDRFKSGKGQSFSPYSLATLLCVTLRWSSACPPAKSFETIATSICGPDF